MNYIDPLAKLMGEWSWNITVYSILLRVIIPFIFAFYVGCERSTKGHTAGLKTFILLSLASTSCMIIDRSLQLTFPICSAGAVIGSAMLGGNSILFGAKNQIKGLTTSAWLWTCSIFGLLFGAGLYTVALILAAVYIVILQFFPALEKYLKQRSNHFELHLELRNKNDLQAFMTTLRELGMRIDDVELNSAFINSRLSVYAIKLTIESKELKKYKTHDEIIEALRSIDYIHYIEEK